MSKSAVITKLGVAAGALCAAAVLAGIGSTGVVTSADGDTPPETTAPATTDGHPWHG